MQVGAGSVPKGASSRGQPWGLLCRFPGNPSPSPASQCCVSALQSISCSEDVLKEGTLFYRQRVITMLMCRGLGLWLAPNPCLLTTK